MAFEMDNTDKTPRVLMDADRGYFLLRGICMPEDALAFFEPLFKFLTSYFETPKDVTTIDLDLEYFNTSSTRMLYQFMQLLSSHQDNSNIVINWHYEEDDLDLEEAGEEFKMLATGVQFNLVKKDITTA